jgi:hypothetical protein
MPQKQHRIKPLDAPIKLVRHSCRGSHWAGLLNQNLLIKKLVLKRWDKN